MARTHTHTLYGSRQVPGRRGRQGGTGRSLGGVAGGHSEDVTSGQRLKEVRDLATQSLREHARQGSGNSEDPEGERMGIWAYASYCMSKRRAWCPAVAFGSWRRSRERWHLDQVVEESQDFSRPGSEHCEGGRRPCYPQGLTRGSCLIIFVEQVNSWRGGRHSRPREGCE